MLVQWPAYTHCLYRMSQSSCASVQPGFCTLLNMVKSYVWKILRGIIALCNMTLGVTSNTYCSRKYCIFTVVSSLTYILLPTAAQGLFCHLLPPYTVWTFTKNDIHYVKCFDIWKGRCYRSHCSHLPSEFNQGCTNPGCQFALGIELIWDGILYLWGLNMEFASYQLSGACNFEVATRFGGKYANPCVITIRMSFWIYVRALKLEDFWRVSCIYIKIQHYRSAVRYNTTGLQ